jgi:hypothetical protein
MRRCALTNDQKRTIYQNNAAGYLTDKKVFSNVSQKIENRFFDLKA